MATEMVRGGAGFGKVADKGGKCGFRTIGVVGCGGAFLEAHDAVAGKVTSGTFFAAMVGVAARGLTEVSESYVKISSRALGAARPSISSPASCANVHVTSEQRIPLR